MRTRGASNTEPQRTLPMKRSQICAAAVFVAVAVIDACAGAARPSAQPVTQAASQAAPLTSGDVAAMSKASRDSARYPYTEADIHFMSGMIAHHAQAIKMAKLAPKNDASPSVRTLCD